VVHLLGEKKAGRLRGISVDASFEKERFDVAYSAFAWSSTILLESL